MGIIIAIITIALLVVSFVKLHAMGHLKWKRAYFLMIVNGALIVVLNAVLAARDPEQVVLIFLCVHGIWQSMMGVKGLIKLNEGNGFVHYSDDM